MLEERRMYHKHPQENWLQKGVRYADGALKVYGSMRGLMEMGSAIGGAVRSAYQVAAPAAAAMAIL